MTGNSSNTGNSMDKSKGYTISSAQMCTLIFIKGKGPRHSPRPNYGRGQQDQEKKPHFVWILIEILSVLVRPCHVWSAKGFLRYHHSNH
jgi:hypothetical protein